MKESARPFHSMTDDELVKLDATIMYTTMTLGSFKSLLKQQTQPEKKLQERLDALNGLEAIWRSYSANIKLEGWRRVIETEGGENETL